MRKEILEKTEAFMRRELMKLADFQDNCQRQAEYRIEHSIRVAHIALEIAEAEGLDPERAYVAGLLHDLGYSVDLYKENRQFDHGRVGAALARPFLRELGYSEKETEEICYGIAIHVDDQADFEGERNAFTLTVQDADNIDRFDAFRLYEGLVEADYRELPLTEQRNLVEKRLERLIQLREAPFGTPTATRLWQEKIDFQIAMYQRLRHQIDRSNSSFGVVYDY